MDNLKMDNFKIQNDLHLIFTKMSIEKLEKK